MTPDRGHCWSCGKERGPADALCPSCGKVQAPPVAGTLVDKFAVLGLPQSFEQDEKEIEERHRSLSRRLHPDKFARASARERRYSLEQTTLLNDAARTLKDPVARAQHLLALHGVDASGEPRPGEREPPMPAEFLEEAMSDRERLMEAKMEGGPAEVQKLADEVRGKRGAVLEQTAARLREQKWQDAAQLVSRLRYYARFLDEVEGRGRGFE
jgi:molecular chaperone HscB